MNNNYDDKCVDNDYRVGDAKNNSKSKNHKKHIFTLRTYHDLKKSGKIKHLRQIKIMGSDDFIIVLCHITRK